VVPSKSWKFVQVSLHKSSLLDPTPKTRCHQTCSLIKMHLSLFTFKLGLQFLGFFFLKNLKMLIHFPSYQSSMALHPYLIASSVHELQLTLLPKHPLDRNKRILMFVLTWLFRFLNLLTNKSHLPNHVVLHYHFV